MHYYQFNIGDYHSHTSRLSLLEDLAYRRLIDLYYLNERPLNGCLADVAREIGMMENQPEIEYVLGKYFYLDGDSWANKRADKEIAAYRKKRKQASDAGKASAKARQANASEPALNDRSTDVQPTINHKPITNNQEPVTKESKERADKPTKKQANKPGDVPNDLWSDFLELRKKLRAPLTDTAMKGIKREADKAGITLEQAITTCCERSWRGFKAEWYLNANRQQGASMASQPVTSQQGADYQGANTEGGQMPAWMED